MPQEYEEYPAVPRLIDIADNLLVNFYPDSFENRVELAWELVHLTFDRKSGVINMPGDIEYAARQWAAATPGVRGTDYADVRDCLMARVRRQQAAGPDVTA